MPSLNCQFHMLPEELAEFVAIAARSHALGVVLERWPPKEITLELKPSEGLAKKILEFRPDRLWFLVGRGGHRKDPERMALNVGEMEGGVLRESQLSIVTSDQVAYAACKRIAGDLKKKMNSGAWLCDPGTGAGEYVKNCHLSSGAVDAARGRGLLLKQMGGDLVITPDPPLQHGNGKRLAE